MLLGKFQAISSSQTSTEAEIAYHTCSVQLLSDREASMPIHKVIQISEVCWTFLERSTGIPLLGDPLRISGILKSDPEEPQAVGGMFGLTCSVTMVFSSSIFKTASMLQN